MQTQKNSRVDTGELKAQLFKKVGQERFKRYFHCLNRFINQKLSKSEFDKFCYQILGRENLHLHNQIIKAILKNACSGKTPPPQANEVGPVIKAGIAIGRCFPVPEDGRSQGVITPIWSNGAVPMSPRKGRCTIRDRKLRDRPSPLGPNGKVDSASHPLTASDDIDENGDLAPCDYQRPLHQPYRLAVQPENDDRLAMMKHSDASCAVRGNVQKNAAVDENGEAVERASRLKSSRSPLIAPLGIPYGSASTDVSRKTLPVTHIGDYVSCFDLNGLSDSGTLRRQMEQIAAAQGLGVTFDCANTLNNMVDVYLKRLIKSCLELVGSRSTSDMSIHPVQKQQMHGRPLNGLWPGNHFHIQNNSGGAVEAKRFSQSVSLLDFKVAMELNPQQLGENWPSLLEKISIQGFEV